MTLLGAHGFGGRCPAVLLMMRGMLGARGRLRPSAHHFDRFIRIVLQNVSGIVQHVGVVVEGGEPEYLDTSGSLSKVCTASTRK